MYQIDLLSVLKGINKNLDFALDKTNDECWNTPYVRCAKNQLEEVIEGLAQPEKGSYLAEYPKEREPGMDDEAEEARRELLGGEDA